MVKKSYLRSYAFSIYIRLQVIFFFTQGDDEPKNNVLLCEEWLNCNKFADWLKSNNYKKGMYVHRIDINKGYFPNNCFLSIHKESPSYSKIYDLNGKSNT